MKTILLVDDDAQFRALVTPLLKSRGYAVVEASSGKAALEGIEKAKPDLLVIDGLLPDTDGMTLISQLRKGGLSTKIVFASAFWRDRRTFDRLTNELGVTLVLHKPIVPSLFAEQIEHELGAAIEEDLDLTDDPADEFAALMASYAKDLPQRAALLGAAVSAMRQDPAKVKEASSLAHKLRGTAGSYGFLAVGEAAGEVEDALEAKAHPIALEPLVARVAALAEEAAQRAGAAPTPSTQVTSGERLLLVDANPIALEELAGFARRQLMELSTALDVTAALSAAETAKPDAAVIDTAIGPDEAAFKLARLLRAIPGRESLPIAFTSQDTGVHRRVAAAHAGGSLYLTKPLEEQPFTHAVRQLLAERPSPPKVMIVDDDADFRARISHILRTAGMRPVELADARDIIEVLDRERPDTVLLDVNLPGISGFDVARMLRTSPGWQDIPILFLTARTGVEARVAAFTAGGDDYLAKPVVTEELLARIKVRLERARLIRERSERDALTGLASRRSFMEALSGRVAEAKRRTRPLTIALIDLDKFKDINDQHGHLSGDRVLAGFGKLLTARFRAGDLRGRWGGEEFVLAFPDERLDTSAAIVTRLLEEFRMLRFEADVGEAFSASFSCGVAMLGDDGVTPQELMRTADRRLYLAKNTGRSRVIAKG